MLIGKKRSRCEVELETNDVEFRCEKCSKLFPSEASLKMYHRETQGNVILECDHCEELYCSKHQLHTHLRANKINPAKCEICSERFRFQWYLKEHVLKSHTPKSINCDKCEGKFSHQKFLSRHVKSVHAIRNFTCKICKRAFKVRSDLKRHVFLHSGKKPHQCNLCPTCFPTKRDLKEHMYVHQGGRPANCPVCNKLLGKKYMKTHLRVHTGEKPFKCHVCAKSFACSSTYRVHLRIHSGEKPYPCTHCDKCFSSNSALNMHMRRVHTDDKPHKCSECSKRFISNYNLTIHNRLHSGHRPFICNQCGKGFMRNGNLTNHYKFHEKSKKWKIICKYIDHGLQLAGPSDLVCEQKFKDERRLNYHVQSWHTKSGLQKKLKSETKLAEFFDEKKITYERDRANQISFTCANLDSKQKRAFPDFFLPGISAKLKAIVAVENDEFAHKHYTCDLRRTVDITQALMSVNEKIPFLYIRFNPHHHLVDGVTFDLTLEQAHKNLLKIINEIKPEDLQPGLNIVYVNYDRTTSKKTKDHLWSQLVHLAQIGKDDDNYVSFLAVRDNILAIY